jgi:Domain of unknown function (DUF5103)
MLALACMALLWQACPPAGIVGKAPQQEDSLALQKPLRYDDWVYEGNIKTVQLYRGNNPFTYPILYLGEETHLTLEFDALQTLGLEPEDYWIDAISCDYDWTPSGLLPLEYIEGFSSDRLYFNMRSQNTLIPYVHYRYEFPTQGSSFKKSGNYLLRVYRAGNEKDMILTKRLIVADHKVTVAPQVGLARMATDRRKIQRVDFSLQFPIKFPGIFDPRTDLHVYILQNFRWDNAVGGLQPMFNSPEQLDYTFDAANNFEGGNEYRMVDVRSTRFRTQNVQSIVNEDTLVRYTLVPDEPRLRNSYYSRQDMNGNFVVQVQEYPNASFESDYVFVRFGLKWGEPLKDNDVYLLGKFNDWRRDPENQLSYNALTSRYECELLLKQGVYDYAYVAQNTATGKLDETKFEGSHAETENYYTILVYYKPIGARGSELVGMSHVNFYDR